MIFYKRTLLDPNIIKIKSNLDSLNMRNIINLYKNVSFVILLFIFNKIE